jgi:glucosamine--fructose-6-phosphate aminotransferase (isomerizing)
MIVGEKYWRRLEKRYDSKSMRLNILIQGNSLEVTLRDEMENIQKVAEKVGSCPRFIFSGAGDKYIVPLIAKFLWDHVSEKPLDVYHSRVLADYKPGLDKDVCVVLLTQSGTTKDTLDACRACMDSGCTVVAITNLQESTQRQNIISMLRDYKKGHILRTHTLLYPEEPLPSTNTFHTSLMVLNLLVLSISKDEKLLEMQKRMPALVGSLSISNDVVAWAKKAAASLHNRNFLYVSGDGPRFHIAQKHSKIMLMEGAKIDACAMESEDFVHSLVETLEFQRRDLILLRPLEDWGDRNFDLISELWEKQSGRDRLIVCDPFTFLDDGVRKSFSSVEGNLLSPFLYMVPLEWQAFYLSLLRKVDPGVGKLVKKVRDDDQLKKLIK